MLHSECHRTSRTPGESVIEHPWPETPETPETPEAPERTGARERALVASVASADEIDDARLERVTPTAQQPDDPDAPWVALRLTVMAGEDDTFQQEIWAPDRYADWGVALGCLADALEDWVCETRFAWGQRRRAVFPY